MINSSETNMKLGAFEVFLDWKFDVNRKICPTHLKEQLAVNYQNLKEEMRQKLFNNFT